MDKLRKPFTICMNGIRKWSANPRIYTLAILLAIFVLNNVNPLTKFSRAMGYRITPWVFPFLSSSVYAQMKMMFGIVFLFCDAPFINTSQPYQVIRSGRIQWGIGQVLYIMCGTAIYFMFIIILSILIISPIMFFSDSWGKILSTLAQTNAGNSFNIPLQISYQIQSSYSPIQAFCLSIILNWCCGTILGLIIFITNIYYKKSVGAAVSFMVVCLDMVIKNALPSYMYKISPVSMARLTVLDPSGISVRPTNIYAYFIFLLTIVLLSFFAVLSVRKLEIQVLPPV